MSSSHCVVRAVVVSLAATSITSLSATEVVFCTDAGNFTIELNAERAPLHTESFLRYVDSGHYSGSVFHRVITGFMIQGGGYDSSFAERPTVDGVRNESRNGLSNERGSVAAARTTDPHSASAQFYINLVDNERLDGTDDEWGYTVFGRVTDGMSSVDAIAARATGPGGPFSSDVPAPLVTIHSAARLERDALWDLPAAELEDRIHTEIEAAAAAAEPQRVLRWVDRYRASCAPLEPELLVLEADAAAALALPLRARYALDQYLARANATNPDYDRAVALYRRIAPGKRPAARARFVGCRSPSIPDVPDGSVEDLAGMLEGQASVQAFMRSSTNYLECLDEIIEDEDHEISHRESALTEYNRVVDVTQDLGERFNEEVRAFRERQ